MRASAVYLRETANELHEWLIETAGTAKASEQVCDLILMASGALQRAARELETQATPRGPYTGPSRPRSNTR